uniref:Nucleoredoxin-like protein 2 n=1 Tax=Acartia pacifica TaxID=335913 RepID=A0A0U2M975_ACAPC|nr:nucleoredoxin-like protein 2 [Acartia pacifica]
MDSLAGQQLVKMDGSSHAADEVMADKELILFYFSAHWCPPCKQFTPMLKDFYDEISDEGVEVVFVSSDRSSADMLSYMKESHGDWLATEHNSSVANSLKQKYDISGIPTLVVCKKDGTVITKDGRRVVMSQPPAQAVKTWKS